MEFAVDYQEIGRNIRSFREQNGLSQSKLAEKTGISVQHVCNVENGTVVSLPALLSICHALHVDANSVVGTNLPNTPKVAQLSQVMEIISSNPFDTRALEQMIALIRQLKALQAGESA